MTFEITAIVGNSFGEYQFKIQYKDSEVLKRVKSEIVKEMKGKGYSVDVVSGHLEK